MTCREKCEIYNGVWIFVFYSIWDIDKEDPKYYEADISGHGDFTHHNISYVKDWIDEIESIEYAKVWRNED